MAVLLSNIKPLCSR